MLLRYPRPTTTINMSLNEDNIWNGLTVFQKRELIIHFKNQQVKKDDYEFCDDVWSLIKEYTGIYHIGTEWYKVYDISAVKLYKWYRQNTGYVISNISKLDAEKKKKCILKWFHKKQRNKKLMNSLYSLFTNGNMTCKDFTKYKIGDEIMYDDIKDYRYKLGVIKKVNKASINVNILEPVGWSSALQEVLDEETTINKRIRTNFKIISELTDVEAETYSRLKDGFHGSTANFHGFN